MAASEYRIITPLARLSYPAIFKPAKPFQDGGKEKYQCELIFPAGTDISELKKIATKCARDKWGENMPKKLRSPFRSGTEDRETEEYQGAIFICPRSVDKPGVVVGPNREPCLDESEVYGGCWVRASVTAFAYDQDMSKGIAFALNNIWKVRDDESFSGRVSAEDEFSDVQEDGFDTETVDSLL